MSEMPVLDFWLDLASTYSALSAHRIGALSRASGVTVRWRPVLLGVIFSSQGLKGSPFNAIPAKGRHMWRDVERRGASNGLAVRRPSVFPCNSLLANRVLLVGLEEGWGERFAREAFRAEFEAGRDIGLAEVVAECVLAAGGEPASSLARASSEPVKQRLRQETAAAVEAGVFGAPSFVAPDGELFWGDDRLEEALAWARGQHPLQRRAGA